MILAYLPHCSHVTPHMGFHTISPEVKRLVFDLVQEYNLDANLRYLPMRQVSLFEDANTLEEMISTAVIVLDNLTPGTWDFYDHPGMIIEGEELAWHIGAEDDAIYRARVTKALMSKQLQEVIERRNIQLIGYRDLKFWH